MSEKFGRSYEMLHKYGIGRIASDLEEESDSNKDSADEDDFRHFILEKLSYDEQTSFWNLARSVSNEFYEDEDIMYSMEQTGRFIDDKVENTYEEVEGNKRDGYKLVD